MVLHWKLELVVSIISSIYLIHENYPNEFEFGKKYPNVFMFEKLI